MEHNAGQPHIEKTDARAGSTPHIVRYVLLVSLLLAIVALSAIWITGALSTQDVKGEVAQSDSTEQAQIQEQTGEIARE